MGSIGFLEICRSILNHYSRELITSMISGATCGVIGCFVILRRMALIGDALSHSILPGVALAFMLAGTSPLVMFIGAMTAGMVTSFAIAFLQKQSRMKEDSAVGLVFSFLFALGIIFISALPKGTHFDLKCFLFGNPLAIRLEDSIMMASVGILVCTLVYLFYRPLAIASFDPIMATTVGIDIGWVHYFLMALLSGAVVSSLVSVGVIMVVAMIIAPGITAYQLTDRLPHMILLSGIIGAASAATGFILSFWLNWPVGPAMTVTAGIIFFLALLFSPKYGLIFHSLRQRRLRTHFLEEDLLKAVVRHFPKGAPLTEILQETGMTQEEALRLIKRLAKRDLITFQKGEVFLTGTGKILAEEILRAHRLFEAYMTSKGVDKDYVHFVAEALEHAHEISEEIDQELGKPVFDPHGQTIPPKSKKDKKES
ncbi:MAG: hypothetical protein D6785_09615 [Planctomycetota bacterium]|nr:MAG: hypothetical protein D6785_09615 [Planctomycetota bacterium]